MLFLEKNMAIHLCGLVLFILMIGSHQVLSIGSHCVMYGFCGENDYGEATCSYNGTALALDDENALEILKEICPDVIRESNLTCCSAEQVEQLKENLEIAASLGLARCPSCLSNFRKNVCQFACSPRQSDFMKVTGLGLSDEGGIVIEKMSYYMSTHYADGMFASCKDIQGNTPGSTVLDLMCGGWGRDCTPKHWLSFMGSTPANNGFSPFEINYHLVSESCVVVDGEKFIPMNENTTLCSEAPYAGAEACTCLDCEAACQLNIATPPPLPEEPELATPPPLPEEPELATPPPLPEEPEPWLIMNYDGISVVFLLIFCFSSSFMLLGFLYFRIQSRKSLR